MNLDLRNLVHLLSLLLAVLLCGCFTGIRKMGEATSGHSSTTAKVASTGLDVVTAPIQLPIWAIALIESNSGKKRAEKDASRTEQFQAQLHKDPEVIFQDKWMKDDHKTSLLARSFGDPTVPYTDPILRRIFAEGTNCWARDYVFLHPACSVAFLVESYPDALRAAKGYNYVRLASIVTNTNTPIELVKPVAESQQLPMGAVGPARTRLRLGH